MLVITGGSGQLGTHLCDELDLSEVVIISRYLSNINLQIETVRKKIAALSRKSKVAVYCPSRMLNMLPIEHDYYFIDDDSSIHGKYYPPFQSIVTGIDQLDTENQLTQIIASRTFFAEIVQKLPKNKWNIVSIQELLSEKSLG